MKLRLSELVDLDGVDDVAARLGYHPQYVRQLCRLCRAGEALPFKAVKRLTDAYGKRFASGHYVHLILDSATA